MKNRGVYVLANPTLAPFSRARLKSPFRAMMRRNCVLGRAWTCLPTALGAFTPVNKAVPPVALWGTPSTPRQASASMRRKPGASFPHKSPSGGSFTRESGLPGPCGAIPRPSTNTKRTDMLYRSADGLCENLELLDQGDEFTGFE